MFHSNSKKIVSPIIGLLFSLCLMNSPVSAGWQTETVDGTVDKVGTHTSLAFDTSGYPAISYHDATNGHLKYAHFNGSSWDMTSAGNSRRARGL